MQLSSSAFLDGETIPRRYTCDGDNVSPPLSWSAPPKGTKSFAVLCEDPDAPGRSWHHWAIYDIPQERQSLAEHVVRSDGPDGSHQARNDFHKAGYDGPCPPLGHGPHRYKFRLVALSVEHLPLQKGSSCEAVSAAVKNHTLATADLTGLYAR